MKTALALGMLGAFAVLLTAKSYAVDSDYYFMCENIWDQSVTIKVTADSLDNAWTILKTDKQYADNSPCSFTHSVKAKPKHKHITPINNAP